MLIQVNPLESQFRKCACGCGSVISKIGSRGYKKRFCVGHGKKNQKGEKNNNWKGGKVTSMGDGYVYLRCEGHPRAKGRGCYVQEHVLVVEKMLGRYLNEFETVHHINEDKYDNRIENLQVFATRAEHSRFHRLNEYKLGRRCGWVWL